MADSKQSKNPTVHKRRFVPAGTVVMKEGERGRHAYLVQSGEVSVAVTDVKTGKTVEVACLTPGQIFGEMALVTDAPRSATVTAKSDCNLILIERGQLDAKLENSDPTIRALMPMLMKRLGKTNEALVQKEYDIGDMIATVKSVYQNISAPLVPSKRKTFENLVKPKLDYFVQAIETYKEKYQEEDNARS